MRQLGSGQPIFVIGPFCRRFALEQSGGKALNGVTL
jgi:hypothetical protein